VVAAGLSALGGVLGTLAGCNTCTQADLDEGGVIRKCFEDKSAYVDGFDLNVPLIKDCDEGKWHDNNREELEIERQSDGVPGGIAGGENARRRSPVCHAAKEALACFNAQCCDLVLPVTNAESIDHTEMNSEQMNRDNFVNSQDPLVTSGPRVRVYTACLKMKAEDAIASEYYQECKIQNNGEEVCKGSDCVITDPCASYFR
jgi:hypothetical protein